MHGVMDRRSNAGRNLRLREAADRSIDQGRRLDRTSMVAGAYTALALLGSVVQGRRFEHGEDAAAWLVWWGLSGVIAGAICVGAAIGARILAHLAVGVTAAIEPVPQPREQDHYR